jgi:hypothetical protein
VPDVEVRELRLQLCDVLFAVSLFPFVFFEVLSFHLVKMILVDFFFEVLSGEAK